MKKTFAILAAALMFGSTSFAQEQTKEEDEGYKFTVVKELPITSVKDQSNAGTCWCYSTLGFIEAELLRMGKPAYDFSEMYLVSKTYHDRAAKAVRMHGDISFSQGGSFYDVIYGMKHYGLVPEEVMRPGVQYNDTLSHHGELSALTDAMVAAIAKKDGKLQTDGKGGLLWLKAVDAVHDIYLGSVDSTFVYNGVTYTPMSYYESTGLNADDYVSLTSYTHHPFYGKFILEIQDNWRWAESYNLPIDEFMQVFDYAIDNNYPIAWGSDVSEKGFRLGVRKGFCVLPETDTKSTIGSDQSKWSGMSAAQLENEAAKHPTPQRWVTQEDRQIAYDNFETTDDHGMVIYGKATDQMGNEYYMVKNSWGNYGEYKGMFYASKAFVRYKTMNIMVHKNAIPKDIKKKLGIK